MYRRPGGGRGQAQRAVQDSEMEGDGWAKRPAEYDDGGIGVSHYVPPYRHSHVIVSPYYWAVLALSCSL